MLQSKNGSFKRQNRQGETVHSHIVNISLVLTGKMEIIKGIAADNSIQIIPDIEENLYIKIASPALDRILDIILDNAITYNMPQGTIHISLKSNAKAVILVVRNTGQGISKDRLEQIFTPRGQGASDKKGMRKGLPWVKNIINDISGNISIEINENRETTLTIKFKRKNTKNDKQYKFIEQIEMAGPVKKKRIRLKPETYTDKKKTILVIEKDPELLCFMQEQMKKEFNFFYIRDFLKEIQKLETMPKPDIVIINMTERDYNISGTIHESWEYQNIMLVFYTVAATKRELLKGFRYGSAVEYLDKPCSIDVLCSKIKAILRYRDININRTIEDVKRNIFKAIKSDKKGTTLFEYKATVYDLTEREKKVIRCIVKGMENQEIAEKIGVDIDSVERYIKNAQEKCGLHTRLQLLNFFRNIEGVY